ncbi:MAG TPA: DUF2911 domain-containing protein [Vicinamibacterales bacterium]|nr:DUF2911 domain-containing protein [Vicinamibacterales bacterium]
MRRSVLFGVTILMAAATLGARQQQQTPPVAQTPSQPAQQMQMPMSPRGTAATQVSGKWIEEKPGAGPRYRGGKWIVVDYGRPILRGRTNIFGTGAEYGKAISDGESVWRAGANHTTRLRTEVPLVFGGKTVAAGEYSVFVELKEDAWTFVLSTQPVQVKYDPQNKTETFGSYNYDPKFDVLRVPMKLATNPDSIDQFTIGFANMTPERGELAMWWDRQEARVGFTVGS